MLGRILIFAGGALAGYLFREEIGQGLDRLQDTWDECSSEEADEKNTSGNEEAAVPIMEEEVTAH